MKEKREKTELMIEGKKQVESVEERKKRLQAQRDLLVKQKQEKREKELEEFKEKTTKKEDLHKELLEMDKKIQAKDKVKQSKHYDAMLDMDELAEHDSPEVDKRLQIYKNMRGELLREESKAKEDGQRSKMDDINAKIAKLEKIKKEKGEK